MNFEALISPTIFKVTVGITAVVSIVHYSFGNAKVNVIKDIAAIAVTFFFIYGGLAIFIGLGILSKHLPFWAGLLIVPILATVFIGGRAVIDYVIEWRRHEKN